MKVVQQNSYEYQSNNDSAAAPYLSEVNQQILQRLKQQQAERIRQKKISEEQNSEYQQQVPPQQNFQKISQTDLVPASGQFNRNQQPISAPKDNSIHSKINSNSQKGSSEYNGTNSNNQNIEDNISNDKNYQEEEQHESSHQKEHLLVMTIDLGEGNCDLLQVYEEDDPYKTAEEFCVRNGLAKEAMEILAKNIEVNKQIVITERQHQQYHNQQAVRGQSPPGKQFTQTENYYASKNPLIQQTNQQEYVRDNYYKNQGIDPQNQFQNQDGIINEDNQGYSQNEEEQQQQNPQEYNQSAQKQTIFDRLYNDAALKGIRKQRKQDQESNNSQMSNTGRQIKKVIGNTVLNLGEYLYQKGLIMKNNQKQNAEEYILMHKPKEMDMENPLKVILQSKDYCQKKREISSKAKEKMQQLKNVHLSQFSIQCNKISKGVSSIISSNIISNRSEYLVGMKKRENDQESVIFDQLHEEARLRNIRKEERDLLDNECTFHPKISRPPRASENLSFVDRMMKSVNEKQKKAQDQKMRHQSELIDKEDSTFHPQIGRPPKERNTQGMGVHEYLFHKNEEKKIKSEIQQKEEEIRLANTHTTSLESSSQIVDKVRREKLLSLFQQLDVDGDGLISSQNTNDSQIPDNIRSILSPLLNEIEQHSYILNFEQFYEASLRLLQGLNVAQKDELLHSFKEKWDEKKQKFDKFDHKPQINNRSALLARKRSYEKVEDLYQHGMNKQREKEYKMAQIKSEQIKKELNNCTFKPNLFKPMKIYSFTDPKIQKLSGNFLGNSNGAGEFKVTGILNNTPTINSIQQ